MAAASEFTPTERDLLVEAAIDVIDLSWIAAAVRAEMGEGPAPRSVLFTPEVGEEILERVRRAATSPGRLRARIATA
jgi:hypothetical protein